MQPAPAATQGPETTSLPPPPKPRGGTGASLPTILAAIALALAVVALAVSFVVPGPTGAQGASGTSGTPTVTYFAVVGSTGALSRDSNVTSSYLVATGHFEVNFTTIQNGCTYVADLGVAGPTTQPAGSVTVTPPPAGGTDVNVSTFNATGVATDEGFYVVATCPGGLFASVNATGAYVSGDQVESSLRIDTGAYQVLFNQDIAGCAYVAGLGTTGGGSPPAGSATVAPRAGHANGVWVNTYNATGGLTNDAFHVSVYC